MCLNRSLDEDQVVSMLNISYNKLDDEISLEGSEVESDDISEVSESHLRLRPVHTLANSAATAQQMMQKRGLNSGEVTPSRPCTAERPGTAQSLNRRSMTWSQLPNLDASCPASLLRDMLAEEGKLGSRKWRPPTIGNLRSVDLMQQAKDSHCEEDRFAETEPPGSSAFWFQEQMFASQHTGCFVRPNRPCSAARLPPLPVSPKCGEGQEEVVQSACGNGSKTEDHEASPVACKSVVQRSTEKTAAGSGVRAVRSRKQRFLSVPRASFAAFRQVFAASANVQK